MELTIISIIEGIGAILFLIAAIYSLILYKRTSDVSDFWMIFAIGNLFGFFWLAMVSLEWTGFQTNALDNLQQIIAGCTATAFAISAIASVNSVDKSK